MDTVQCSVSKKIFGLKSSICLEICEERHMEWIYLSVESDLSLSPEVSVFEDTLIPCMYCMSPQRVAHVYPLYVLSSIHVQCIYAYVFSCNVHAKSHAHVLVAYVYARSDGLQVSVYRSL